MVSRVQPYGEPYETLTNLYFTAYTLSACMTFSNVEKQALFDRAVMFARS